MDESLHGFGNNLNTFLDQNRPNEAEGLISQVNKALTETELSSFTIDAYLLNIFNKSNGLLIFFNKIVHKPEYKKTKLKCFELLYTLVNNCVSKVQNHLIDIIKACSPVVRSSASAIEKQKSLQLITLIIYKGNLHADRQNDIDMELGDLYNNTLFKCLHCRFDKSNTVQEELLVAIGALAKKFPAVISDSSKLRNILITQLNAELQKSNKSYPVITGCVSALSNFLENFPFNPDEDRGVADTIYKCVKILADPGDASRRVAFRESLNLVTKHIVLLSNALYSESKWWHTTLLKWFSLGIEDKKAAYGILDAFHREMANILSIRNEESDHEVFKYFMDYFSDVVEKSCAENYEMQLAIRGYGLFARSFKVHITASEINKTFITISQIMEHTYILNTELNSDQIMYLPHYVQTLSCIIKNLPQLCDTHVSCLQRVCVLMIKIFPKVTLVQHYLVVDAFILTSYQLLQCKNNLLEMFLEDVIYQGVLWTCSHQIALEAELYKDEERPVTTYKHYLPFWNGILSIINSVKYEKFELNMRKRKLIVRKLLDELIKTLFLLISKLNLNTKLKDSNLPITDPESAYEALQTNDFVIFINVVDFYQDILENIDKEMFEIWINRFINQVILKSMKHPLVSGFYKLLAGCLKVADSLNYFEESKLISKEDLTACFQSVCKFLEEILWKMKQYKGDLQVACMQVILAAPICTVKDLLPCAAPAFIALFSVGRSYLKLADVGIDTLEKWLQNFPQNDFIPFLKQVLPSLDSYLKSRSLGGNVISTQVLKSRKTKLAVGKRKVLVETDSELLKLQIKILTFIGQLDSDDLYLTFISSGDNIEPVVWSTTPYLKITLPYADTKLNLYLDKFIPRTIDLALYSSDRKIRVAACELLHAIVIIILGTSHPIDPPKLKDLDCLIKAVSAPILKLGCDMDQVIQQLFSPLALQLMHYYSHPRQMCSSHTQIVIETLIEAIANPSDSALRDFAGICIKEFVLWTIKQSDADELKNNPINIKLWVRTVYSFSLHPDPFKRLGAALIFNHIYTILREETHMFNMFWLEILYAFVINLSLIQVNNMDDNNCIDQVSQALNHIQRGFVEKHALFNSNDNIRRKPPGFEGTLLKDVAIWLLKETGSINPHCRQKCMSMFCKIAPLVTNCNNNLQTFKELFIVTDSDWILATYEAELLKHPTLTSSEDTSKLFKWMQGLVCALDGYIFVITNNLIPSTVTAERSNFFEALQFFLQSVQLQTLDEVVKLISDTENSKVYTAIEKENFNGFKSSIVTKIIKFVAVVIENKANLTYITPTPQLLWNNNLWNLMCHRIFYASTLGFDVTNDDSYDALLNLLNEINNYCPPSTVTFLINTVATYIVSTLTSNINAGLDIISLKQRHLLKGLLLLQQSHLAQKLSIGKYVIGTVKSLLNGLTETKAEKRVVVKLHNSASVFWQLRLDIALQDMQEFNDMIDFMCNHTIVTIQDQNEDLEYGMYFFQKFKNVIVKHIVHKHYAIFTDKVFKLTTIDNAIKYVLEILRYIYHNPKMLEQNILQDIVTISVNNMENILPYFDTNTVQTLLGMEFLSKLAHITIEPLYNLTQNKPTLTRWIISLIDFEDMQWNTEASLNFKADVFKVLSFVIGPVDQFEPELRNALQNLTEKYFTIKQNNLSISQITVFKNLLETVKISKSKVLLSCAVNIYIIASFSSDEIDLNCPLKSYMRCATVEHQIATLDCIYNICLNTDKFTSIQRYLLVKDVLAALLKCCYYSAFEQFFVTVINSVLSFLDTKYNPQDFNMIFITNKVIAYILIELLFSRINIENIEKNSCLITKAACGGKIDKKLSKMLTQYALKVCKENYNLCTPDEKNMFHLYQCHSYNALVSIISNTQKEITFYNWLFSREENKQDILWKNLVDTEKKYSFPIDFDTVPSEKKKLVNIRKDLLANRKNIDPDAHTIKYIESQHLFKSTLSEDITRFDFTHTILRNQIEGNESQTEGIEKNQEFYITLEAIDINKHECMATICGLIQHMSENDIIPLPMDNENILLPKWMKAIINIIMEETTANNVKLFLVKVIHNTHYIFKPYAKWFIPPIIKTIVDGCAGNTVNFFITDLVVMLTTWSNVAIPIENQEVASELLKFLMNNADSDHRAIFKYNLEQIKLILEVWKSCLVIPYDLLYQKLQLELTSPQLDVGVHLVAAVLANNIAPWHPTDVKKFLMTLTKILKSTHRSVYQPCAEVLGMSLKYMSTHPDFSQHLNQFKDHIHKCLLKFITDDDKFAYCLQGLALHFPDTADAFLCRMMSKLSHIHGNFKCMYLKIFLTRIEVLHEINELSSITFQTLLVDENFEVQVLTLEIIQKSVEYLKNTQLIPILKEVSKFISSSVIICRTIMYDIIITSYNLHDTQQSEASREITEICRDILLQGLVDKELSLQEKVITFWSNVNNLPVDIGKRFLYLLGNMYKANIEEHYVSYSTYLLLNVLGTREEFNEKLFQFALYECDFQDYQLISNWRRQHASIAPLFAETLRSQDNTINPMNFNVLRPTISTLEFQPTEAGPSTSTVKYSYFANSGSLLFNTDATSNNQIQDGAFKDPNRVISATESIRSRRFLRDKSKISRHCAYLETKKSLKAEELRKDRIKQSERNVTICRKYRIGDYPDVEITLASVITPLQILARCDAILARCLYISLFTSLFDKMEKDGKQDDNFVESIKSSINSIFNGSTQFIPNTIGTFLDIALKYKNTLQFDASTITSVCHSCGLFSVGSLLLEEYLISEDVDYVTPAKRRKGVESQNILRWVKFAELYKEMDEWDVVSAVFLEKMNCSEIVLKAIEAESCGNWRSAQECYAQVIAEDTSEERRDFYYESYFKCFAALGEWNTLSVIIKETVGTDTEDNVWPLLWDDDWNQQKLLPWYITAELRNVLNGTDRKLFVSVNESLNDIEKFSYLKLNFGEELAMLWLLQNDSETATYYLNTGMTNFLENWSHLNPLFVKLRINKVFNLRNMVDIHLFLNAVNDINLGNQKNTVETLLTSWQKTTKDFMESLILSETRTVYRNQFLLTLQTKLQSILTGDDMQNKDKSLNECKFKLHLNLVESALDQGNYYVARKYIKLSPKPNRNNQIEMMQWSLALSKILFLRAQIIDNSDEKLSVLIKSWSQIHAACTANTEDDAMCYLIKTKEHIYQLTQEIFRIISRKESLFTENQRKLKPLIGNFSLENITSIWNFGMRNLQNSLDFCENEIQLMMNNENLKTYAYMGNAYVKLAYCTQNKEELENDFISFVLKAMKYGSIEGKQLFPCLLSKDIGVTFRDTFIKESSQIPIWMFLKWLPQLLANLDTSCIFVISEILLKIAKIYPQAIMYAYRLSKEKYTFRSDSIGILGREMIEKLDDLLLHDDLIDKFLRAVACVAPPINILSYHLRKLMNACDSKEQFSNVLQKMCDEVYSETPDYKDANSTQGSMFKEIRKFETKIKNIAKGKFDKTENSLKILYAEANAFKYKKSVKLVEYSPWLANFQTTNLHANLEIPGQYTGEKRPLVQFHTKIMGFSQNVQCFSSIRAPIRITILGNDAKEYYYLIKYGEDLRQDQRIEQIFSLMNNILLHDANCHKRQLSIYTYQVIPLNSCLGVIEWVNNTSELKEFIENGISNQQDKLSYKKADNEYASWIAKAQPRNQNGTHGTCYGLACIKYSRDNVICKYRTLVNSLPMDVLRKSFWNISVSSESFFALRHRFAVSYAAMCISHWLLGIGDRHLLNCLVSLRTGQAIGIDFGHAFGTATQILQVPELVPFRLTPHILYLLQPLGEQGLLQETMIHCLRAFRKQSDILLATMNVFIKEPSLDWLEFSRRSELNNQSTDQDWYPNKKIMHAQQKLEGANPTSITIEELQAGHKQSQFLDAYINLVKGVPEHNFRARKADKLSEEDQVKCLLDQSTDYNLLGRMWIGWQPWI